MGRKELLLASIIPAFFILAANIKIITSNRNDVEKIYTEKTRIVLGTASLLHPENPPEAALDDDLHTFYRVEIPGKSETQLSKKSVIPDTRAYLYTEAGLTHFPGIPPERNPLHSIIILLSDYENPGEKSKFARPKKIRIAVFLQNVVDIDREYKLHDSPVFLQEVVRQFPDTSSGTYEIPIQLDKVIPESRIFHENISRYWIRIEFLEAYPGKIEKNTIHVSELQIIKEFQDQSLIKK